MPGQKTNAVVIRKNACDLRNRNARKRIGTIVPVFLGLGGLKNPRSQWLSFTLSTAALPGAR
jgi:hypothetical protein